MDLGYKYRESGIKHNKMVFKKGEICKNWNGFSKTGEGNIRARKSGKKGGSRSTFVKAYANALKNFKHGRYSNLLMKCKSSSEAVLRDLWGEDYEKIMEWERKWEESMALWNEWNKVRRKRSKI